MTRDLALGMGLPALACCIVISAAWAMTVGSADLGLTEVARAIWSRGDDRADMVVWSVRLPRVLAGVTVGALLAVAGAIMQAVTGNPMADPGLLGINAGASFAAVLTIAFFGITSAQTLVWAAFVGAAVAAGLVYALGSAGRSGATPIKLVLAGVVIATFLGAMTMSVLILSEQTFDAVRLWSAGSLRGRQLPEVGPIMPHAALALVVALLLREQFTIIGLGAGTAQGVGQNQALWRGLAAILVVALAGSAVAMAGPLGFVGLVVPHIVRLCVGGDYRWVLPYSALGGALLTLGADTLPRALLGLDVPVGVTMAIIGGPVLVWLARTRTGERS